VISGKDRFANQKPKVAVIVLAVVAVAAAAV